MRTLLGLPKVAPINFMYGDIDWIQPKQRQICEKVRLWYRITSMPDDRLTKFIFLNDKSNWKSSIRDIFNKCELQHLFNSNNVQCIPLTDILQKVSTYIYSISEYKWRKEICVTSRLSLYSIFKHEIKLEDYVYVLRNRRKRSIIARLRSSTLNLLAVEYGRYRNVPRTERQCIRCERPNEVEDEEHFLLKCAHFSDRRNALLMLAKNVDPSFESFTDAEKTYFLLSNADVVNATASYVIDCLY